MFLLKSTLCLPMRHLISCRTRQKSHFGDAIGHEIHLIVCRSRILRDKEIYNGVGYHSHDDFSIKISAHWTPLQGKAVAVRDRARAVFDQADEDDFTEWKYVLKRYPNGLYVSTLRP